MITSLPGATGWPYFGSEGNPTCELVAKLRGHLRDRSEVDVHIGMMAYFVAALKEDQINPDSEG